MAGPFGSTITLWMLALLTFIETLGNKTGMNKIVFNLEDELLSQSPARRACPDLDTLPVVKLLNFISLQYLTTCTTVILYDEFFYQSLTFQPVIMDLLRMFPSPMLHDQFASDDVAAHANASNLLTIREHFCTNYIVLAQTLETVAEMLGHQPESKVILVAEASKWKITNFLKSSVSDQLVNLLVVADPTLQLDIFSESQNVKIDINLYTHELYADPLGTRVPKILTAWRCNRLTRPWINLFPTKMTNLNGYQMRVVASEQPPYVYQSFQLDSFGDAENVWDGLEVRILNLISNQLNFTVNLQQPSKTDKDNRAKSVLADLTNKRADIAVAGMYATVDGIAHHHMSIIHSHDCAVFMTLASTALPKYRAIMGPFRWEVWMTITLAYLFAIIPISFSAHHSLRILIHDPWEIENMFWYVFGTFTNCFTFSGHKSWTSGKMASTRLFIGSYWAFSIIISAAYTGSIIAFIMLPIFPEVMETPSQLLDNDYTVIVTNNSELEQTLHNSTDPSILKLSHDLTVMDSIDSAVGNVSDPPFFTDYTFLHSRETLKHLIRTNFAQKLSNKKSAFHLSQNCFVPMLVTMLFPADSIVVQRVNLLLQRAFQGGFFSKLTSDVAWDQQRSGAGKLLQVSGGGSKLPPPEDRQLTLDDTQGMFLLLGAGFAIATVAFIAECFFAKSKRTCTRPSAVPSIVISEDDSSPRCVSSCDSHSFLEIEADVHVQAQIPDSSRAKRTTQSLLSFRSGRIMPSTRHPSI